MPVIATSFFFSLSVLENGGYVLTYQPCSQHSLAKKYVALVNLGHCADKSNFVYFLLKEIQMFHIKIQIPVISHLS